ncbi:undecaprenyl-diphosphate phosphatase [Baaleninema simplex]|uniref:undecaprenyl-diphosphate phosphatase n=1 Tax=Baaleninema simplex TaxID=2862350 RepID=UPI00034A5AFD|nr:undecaprenyl-diphosphate phosphatase [Baaleninema simplex]
MTKLQTLLFVSTVSLCVAIALPLNATDATSELVTWTPDVFQAAVLGMVQGLTEFIPISSTAHLKVVPELLGWGDPGSAFSAVIQLGSIVAVFGYFWQDLVQVVGGSIRAISESDYDSPEFRIALGIAIGTLPIVGVGLLVKFVFREFYEANVRSLAVIAIVSIVMGVLLGLAEKLCRHKRGFQTLSAKDGILMGLAQTLALVPGVSRSGSTITAGLFMGLERATAARFSFLLGLPAITLAGLVELKDVFETSSEVGWMPLASGLLSAGVFSYLAIAWLIRFLQTRSTWVFVWYRVIFGIFILVFMRNNLSS